MEKDLGSMLKEMGDMLEEILAKQEEREAAKEEGEAVRRDQILFEQKRLADSFGDLVDQMIREDPEA